MEIEVKDMFTIGNLGGVAARGTTSPRSQPHGETSHERGDSDKRHRTALALVGGFLAANAWYGALGLATGRITIGDTLTARLPFGSAVLGGVALAVVVAIPATSLTVLAVLGNARRLEPATFVVGAIVAVWILIELAFVREVSFLHPAILLYGAALMIWSRRSAPQVRHGLRHPADSASALAHRAQGRRPRIGEQR